MCLLSKMLMSLVFATSVTSEKRLIIQSVNIVMNNKSTQNTQENVVKYSFIEFSVFSVRTRFFFSFATTFANLIFFVPISLNLGHFSPLFRK